MPINDTVDFISNKISPIINKIITNVKIDLSDLKDTLERAKICLVKKL
jgi:hypothetical protein